MLPYRSRSPISISFWLIAALICESLLMIYLKPNTNSSSVALVSKFQEMYEKMLNLASYQVYVTFDETGQLGNTMSFHTIEPGEMFKRNSSALVATNLPQTDNVYVKKNHWKWHVSIK